MAESATCPQSDGPLDAKMLLLGEAPAGEEMRQGRPFVGDAGEVLARCLTAAGIERSDVRILNIWGCRVSKDDRGNINGPEGKLFWTPSRGFTTDGWEAAAVAHQELQEGRQNIQVALGLTALSMLAPDLRSGREKWSGLISRWRGSVWQGPLYDRKMTATFHPANVVWGATHNQHVIAGDLKKAAAEAEFPEIRRRPRTRIIDPNKRQIEDALQQVWSDGELWFDVEMFNGQLSAVSFTSNEEWAICVPLLLDRGVHRWSQSEELWFIGELANLLASPDIVKGNQNITFDLWAMLWAYGIRHRGVVKDPMVLHHIVYPEMPKTLAFQASWLTDIPFWKDDGGKELWRAPWDNLEKFWLYGCNDALAPPECFRRLAEEHLQPGSPYQRTYDETMEMVGPLTFMMLRGVRVDAEGMLRSRDEQVAKQVAALARCQEAGLENPLSSKQCAAFFFGDAGHGADKFALLRIIKEQGKLASVAADALEVRRAAKQVSNYFEMPLVDGRMMTSYDIRGTNTGRLSSSRSTLGGGANEQNLTTEFTRWLVPDGWDEDGGGS